MAPLLDVDSISVSFGGLLALGGASIDVQAGRVTGLIGPNGAGKTTLFNIVSGFMRPERGTVVFDGRRVDRMAAHRVSRRGLVPGPYDRLVSNP